MKAPKPQQVVNRQWFKPVALFWGVAGFVGGMLTMALPPVSAAIGYVTDRFKNGADRDSELKDRAKFYRVQIANQLGIRPEQVGVSEFRMAAESNPMLNSAYNEVIRKEKRENRTSGLVNGAVALVPGGAVVGKAAAAVQGLKMVRNTVAGMGVSMLFNREIVSAQDVIEAVGNDMLKAQSEGRDMRTVVTPREIFMLRVAQDEALNAEIKKTYGKSFHKLDPNVQQAVMGNYQQLTNAVTSEAHAVATGMMPLQELMARAPNMASSASNLGGAQRGGSFASRIQAERAMQGQLAAGA